MSSSKVSFPLTSTLSFFKGLEKNPLLRVSLLLLGIAFTYKTGSILRRLLSTALHQRPIYDDLLIKTKQNFYDVCVVGAGPSGSSCAYFLAEKGFRVLLVEKKKFPRDKYCGDAVNEVAQSYLRRMGIFEELISEGKVRFSRVGGFVSPAGYSVIANSAQELGVEKENFGVMCAIKRIDLDEKIAKAAQRRGAILMENTTVKDAKFSIKSGTWKVFVEKGEEHKEGEEEEKKEAAIKTESSNPKLLGEKIYARILICADGSPSALARQLGIVEGEPNAVCSRQYIKSGSHQCQVDGLVFYPSTLLPGYAAIFREADGDLNYLTYIIPGGRFNNENLRDVHENLAKNDKFINKLIGDRSNSERMKAASLRLGGVNKSYADHCLVIGDAAGLIDPLTGEGIHWALHSGFLAATTIMKAYQHHDFTSHFLASYEHEWRKELSSDFLFSASTSKLLYYFPFLLDGTARLIKKRGREFFLIWVEVMCGRRSKLWLLRPEVGGLVMWEGLKSYFSRWWFSSS